MTHRADAGLENVAILPVVVHDAVEHVEATYPQLKRDDRPSIGLWANMNGVKARAF